MDDVTRELIERIRPHLGLLSIIPGVAEAFAKVDSALAAGSKEPDAPPDKSQDWAALDGATAFHLIERHANDWADAGRMMDAWRAAAPLSEHPVRDEP